MASHAAAYAAYQQAAALQGYYSYPSYACAAAGLDAQWQGAGCRVQGAAGLDAQWQAAGWPEGAAAAYYGAAVGSGAGGGLGLGSFVAGGAAPGGGAVVAPTARQPALGSTAAAAPGRRPVGGRRR